MIYLVTSQIELFHDDLYTIISKEEAFKMMSSWDIIQIDSETTGRDAHICDFLCFQFGNKAADSQIVVDCTTIDIRYFKSHLEKKFVILSSMILDYMRSMKMESILLQVRYTVRIVVKFRQVSKGN